MRLLLSIFLIFSLISAPVIYFFQAKENKEKKNREFVMQTHVDSFSKGKAVFAMSLRKDFDFIFSKFENAFRENPFVFGITLERSGYHILNKFWTRDKYPLKETRLVCSSISGTTTNICLVSRKEDIEPSFNGLQVMNTNKSLFLFFLTISVLLALFLEDVKSSLRRLLSLVNGLNTGHLESENGTKNYLFFRGYEAVFQNALLKAKNLLLISTSNTTAIFAAKSVVHDIRSSVDALGTSLRILNATVEEEKIYIPEDLKSVFSFSSNAHEFVEFCLDGLNNLDLEIDLRPELYRLDDEIRDIIKVLKCNKAFLGKKLTIDLDQSLVYADKSIKRVVFNLIKNAAESCPWDNEITVKLKNHDDGATVTITNKCEMIPKHKLDLIWSPFFSTKGHGRGFGLAIVKGVLNAHKITPVVISNVHSTTFEFTIPRI